MIFQKMGQQGEEGKEGQFPVGELPGPEVAPGQEQSEQECAHLADCSKKKSVHGSC